MLLLNIQSSPRGAKSASIAVTNGFLDAYQALHPDATIDTLNVWEENLPDFDSEAIGAKYKGVSHQPMNAAEAEIWRRIRSTSLMLNGFSSCAPRCASKNSRARSVNAPPVMNTKRLTSSGCLCFTDS